MQIDRRNFLVALGTAAAINALPSETLVDNSRVVGNSETISAPCDSSTEGGGHLVV